MHAEVQGCTQRCKGTCTSLQTTRAIPTGSLPPFTTPLVCISLLQVYMLSSSICPGTELILSITQSNKKQKGLAEQGRATVMCCWARAANMKALQGRCFMTNKQEGAQP